MGLNPLKVELTKLEWANFWRVSAVVFACASGLYMIFPVLSAYDTALGTDGNLAHPIALGVALGIFGLVQSLTLIPTKLLAERFSRAIIIRAGLLLLIVGSVIAATANNIYLVILGRALQGTCALNYLLLTILADNTREEAQLKIILFTEELLRSSLTFALIIGPFVEIFAGLKGVFISIAAIAGFALLYTNAPSKHKFHDKKHQKQPVQQLLKKIKPQQFLIMNFGTGVLHTMLAALFFVIPMMLRNLGIPYPSIIWQLILFTSIGGLLFAKLFIFRSQDTKMMRTACWSLTGWMLLSTFILWIFSAEYVWVWVGLLGCLIMFQFLESKLQELMNLMAPNWSDYIDCMGIYFSSQSMGIFVGALLSSIIYTAFGPGLGIQAVLLFCMLLGSSWLAIIWLLPFNEQNRFVLKLLRFFEEEDREYRMKIEAAIARRNAEYRS